jgi:thioredoxin-related protein
MKNKIMKILMATLIMLPGVVWAQNDSISNSEVGIHFQKRLSWSEVIKKAVSEHKPIFVDCYTTWCGPCKTMDQEVYTDSVVGEFCDTHFVSVKFQMDRTKSDDEAIQASYKDAAYLFKRYEVNAFPTLLFFSPDGQITNQSVGALSKDNFLKLLSSVLDPTKNYYSLLEKFRQGRRNSQEMRYLIETALSVVQDTIASRNVANVYFGALPTDSLYTPENLNLMRQLTIDTLDMGFRLFYNHASKVNKVMNDDGYSQSIVQGILYSEIVRPALKLASAKNEQPNWQVLQAEIVVKYNRYYAIRTIAGAKPPWAESQHNWVDYCRYLVHFVDTYLMPSKNTGAAQSYILNAFAWDIFQHSKNAAELQSAISWSKKAVLMYPLASSIDTYANLLYKTGMIDLAIQWETIASQVDPKQKDFADNIQKMKIHEPTW